MEYVNVGTDCLKREYMNPVLDTDIRIKPAGGLWCTPHFSSESLPWMNYMLYKPRVFYQKAPKDHPFQQNGVIVDVDANARIFQLHDNSEFDFFKYKYDLSYEKLSRDYDAIFIDIASIFGKTMEEKEYYFKLFSVSSLLLFNLNIIKSYKKVDIDVDPFDFEYDYDALVDYRVSINPTSYVIPSVSERYAYLFDAIVTSLKDYIYRAVKYNHQMSSDRIAFDIYKKIKEMYKKEIEELAKAEDLDEYKLTYALATKSLRIYK